MPANSSVTSFTYSLIYLLTYLLTYSLIACCVGHAPKVGDLWEDVNAESSSKVDGLAVDLEDSASSGSESDDEGDENYDHTLLEHRALGYYVH